MWGLKEGLYRTPFVTLFLIMLQRSCRCVMYRKRWVKCRLEVNTAIGRSSSTIPDLSTGGAVWGISRMSDCKSIHIYPQTPFDPPPTSPALVSLPSTQIRADLPKASWDSTDVTGKHVHLRSESALDCLFCCVPHKKNRSFLPEIHASVQFSQYDKIHTSVSHLPQRRII